MLQGPLPWLEGQVCTLSHTENPDHPRQAGALGIPHPAPARAVEVQGPGQEATSLGQGEASAGKRVHCRERSWGHTVGQVQLWSQTDLRSDFGLEVWGAGGLYS